MKPTLRVLSLYPDQMNIYADRGNITMLRQRCVWRGIGFEATSAGIGDRFDPEAHDLIYIGGGQDRDQEQVAEDMIATKGAALAEAVEGDAVVLAVCGGYQLLGTTWATESGEKPGLGLIDLKTVRTDQPRLIGAVAIETEIAGSSSRVAGFENHGGRTWLGPGVEAWGRVIAGNGNNGEDGTEGVAYRNLIGTYLHGPLLPKNYRLADELISKGLGRRGDPGLKLDEIDDRLEEAAHREALRTALSVR